MSTSIFIYGPDATGQQLREQYGDLCEALDATVARMKALGMDTNFDPVAESRYNMSRDGGKKGGHARAAKLSPERRREIARMGALKRWGKAQ